MSGNIFIISAPSGSGKSTLTNEVRRVVPNLEFSISYTTRPPRGSEQSGREYFFVSREEFERMLTEDEFLEYAEVFGNYYGTAKRFLREATARGHDLLLDIDVQGAAQVKQKVPEAVSIFILPPSREELERRLRRRAQADDELQRKLLGMAPTPSIPKTLSSAGCERLLARLRISPATTIFWSTTDWSSRLTF